MEIKMEKVIEALKFIAEHRSMGFKQLREELIKLGCTFTFDDIKRQCPEDILLFDGMGEGDLGCGASVVANVRENAFGKSYCDDRFLSVDDGTSIYHFVRKVTGDETYTKAMIDAQGAKQKPEE